MRAVRFGATPAGQPVLEAIHHLRARAGADTRGRRAARLRAEGLAHDVE